jgi:hypothetical protein
MSISVFLSCPQPHTTAQKRFVDRVQRYLRERGLEPRTLGVTDYDVDVPLKAIRRLMLESNGLITIALRRTYVISAIIKRGANLPKVDEKPLKRYWITSPYCQIEPAMAFQLGLPTLLLREQGVAPDGLLEKGVVGVYMPEFSLAVGTGDYLESREWVTLAGKWEGQVRAVVSNKASPPRLYGD